MGKNVERLEQTLRSLLKPKCTGDRGHASKRDTQDKLITQGVATLCG